MRARRFPAFFLAGVLSSSLLPSGSATAQTEVDRAAQAAARAEAEMAEARREMESWAAERGTTEARLLAGLDALEQANRRLELAAFELLDLRDDILEAETRLRKLRKVTETRAVEAYMNGTGAELLSLWTASTFAQSALLEETAAAARRAEAVELADLATERERLTSLQDGYDARLHRLEELRAVSQSHRVSLEDLFARVDARYARSLRGLAEADARYREALSEWETAQRRRNARAGVEPWRSLVELYFPEGLVESALTVMRCESGGNPDAVHPESDATGLFQFLGGTWAFSSIGAGFAGASRFDAEANIAAAAWLVDYSIRTGHPRGAWGHWVCQP